MDFPRSRTVPTFQVMRPILRGWLKLLWLVPLALAGCATTPEVDRAPAWWEVRGVISAVGEDRLLLARGEDDQVLVPLGPDTQVARQATILGREALVEGASVRLVYLIEPDPEVPPDRIDLLRGDEAREVRDEVYGEEEREDQSEGILAPSTSPAPTPSPPGIVP